MGEVGQDTGAGEPLELAVVCVTYNSQEHLPGLLASLAPGLHPLRWRLWVVDNASTDSTTSLVERLAPEATVVQTGANLGYAAAVNAGLAAVAEQGDRGDRGDGGDGDDDGVGSPATVLVLNPDVQLDPGCGPALVRALAGGAGIAVPVQHDLDGTVHPTLRREPSVARAWGEALLGGRRAGRHPRLGELVLDPSAYAAPTVADWATGSVMAVSRDCWRAVGRWDERFFLYSEETAFALRARDLGFSLVLSPDAHCRHARGAAHRDPRLWSLLTVNRVRLFATRHPGWRQRTRVVAFTAGVLLGELGRSLRGSATHRAAVVATLRGPRAADRIIAALRASDPAK